MAASLCICQHLRVYGSISVYMSAYLCIWHQSVYMPSYLCTWQHICVHGSDSFLQEYDILLFGIGIFVRKRFSSYSKIVRFCLEMTCFRLKIIGFRLKWNVSDWKLHVLFFWAWHFSGRVIRRDLIYAASVSKMRKMGGSGFHMCGSGGRGFQDAGIAAYSSENAGSRVGRGSKMRPPLIECGLRMRGWGLRVRGSATGPGALGGRGAALPPPHSELPG